MEKCINMDFHQKRTIQSFKSSFFQKFGSTIDIIIRHPELDTISAKMMDDDFTVLLEILDAMIPLYMQNDFPSIVCRTRKREVVNLRMIFMKIAREKGVKLIDIARFCNMKCHSSIIHGSETANDLLITDPQFVDLYQSVISQLNHYYDARINEPAEQIQDNTQPNGSASLHPGKLEAIDTDSELYGRGWAVSETGFFDTRQQSDSDLSRVTL